MRTNRGGTGNPAAENPVRGNPGSFLAPLFPESQGNPWIGRAEVEHGHLVVEKSLERRGVRL